jgi:hypothetical protein
VSSSSASEIGDVVENEPLKKAGSPLVWFEAGPNTQYGLYKAALPIPLKSIEPNYSAVLRQMRVQPIVPALSKKDRAAAVSAPAPAIDIESRKWAIIMVGGGHFAAMIVSLVPKLVKQSGKLEREIVVVESKTFHRYTSALPRSCLALADPRDSPAQARWRAIRERRQQVEGQVGGCADPTLQRAGAAGGKFGNASVVQI